MSTISNKTKTSNSNKQNTKAHALLGTKKNIMRALNGSAVPNQLYALSFPRQTKVKLAYNTYIQSSTTAGLAFDYVFRLNSVFDPDFTSAGHQPQSFDQWAAFYNRYRVDATVVTFEGSADIATTFSILGNNSTASLTAYDQVEESPYVSSKSYSVGGNTVELQRTFDLAKINGVSRSVYNDDDRYQALCSASPTEVLALHCVSAIMGGTSSVVTFRVKLVYEVTFIDPLQQSLS